MTETLTTTIKIDNWDEQPTREHDDGTKTAHAVVNRAVQTFGAAGVSDDTVLARLFAITRALQIADGPSEVHLRTIARLELKAYKPVLDGTP